MRAHKHWKEVLRYAESIRDGKKIACRETKQAVERFFRDLDNPAYELSHDGPEFCIGVIESTLCHQQGEDLDGNPLQASRSCCSRSRSSSFTTWSASG